MDFIDSTFASVKRLANSELPAGVLTNLSVAGIIPGIGILIFIRKSPSCFFYFLLEESGYMSRVVFLMDKIEISVYPGKRSSINF
jgi:ferrous iron transport protein B